MSAIEQSSDGAQPLGAENTQQLAALDIGTNSFHLVVARFTGDSPNFEVVAREKEMVRLGSGSGDMKELEPVAIDRGIAAIGRMRQIAEAHDARLYAVATSAVREAENAEIFIARARDEAGVEVEIISGLEEARLIHRGVLQAVAAYDKQLVLVDIGGGSTEILVGLRGEVLDAGSLKLGCIRLSRRFFRGERLHPAALDSCRRYVRFALAPMARSVQKLGFEIAIGSSGTIGAVAELIHARRKPNLPAPRTLNNFEFTRLEVTAVVAELAGAETLDERRKIKGVDPRRADIILAGAVILEQTMAELGIESMVMSDYALREGLLLDAREREKGPSLHHLHDLRRRNVDHLADLMDDDPDHSRQTARLALELFDATSSWHGFGDNERELLEAAALLANVGQFVSHDKHHKHSYYVIRNTDQLTGYTDHEIELIALVARYHRKSAPKNGHVEYAHLRDRDQHLISTLAGILRVCIGLDRNHAGSVAHVEVISEKFDKTAPVKASSHKASAKSDETSGLMTTTTTTTTITITVTGQSGADLSLELYTANERKDLLESVFGAPIEVVAAN